jgi:hypothetical protein
LPVQVAIDHYDRFAGEVFSQTKWRWKDGTFSATKLEEVVKGIMERSDRDPEERMLDPGRDYEVCNTCVGNVAISLCDVKLTETQLCLRYACIPDL